jgi:hypothetical protein
MKNQYKVYDGRKWMGWGVSATMLCRQIDGLAHDVAKDIILHSPTGDIAIPYGIARVLMSHVTAAFKSIDMTYQSQHEQLRGKRK